MTKLIIFDLDGTLLDTLKDIADACNFALAQCGCPPRRLEEYNQLVGRGISNLFRGALPEDKRTDENIEAMRNHFVPYYREHICDSTLPYDGIYGMLDALAEKGVRFAIASNKYQEGTEQLYGHFFGKYGFTCVAGQKEGRPIKPDPEIIFEAMSASGNVKKEETIYCGDSDVDMLTGHNAGVRTIGAAWGFRGRKELESCPHWLIAENPEEILMAMKTESE